MLPDHYLVVTRSRQKMPAAVQEAALREGTRRGKRGEELHALLAQRDDLVESVEEALGKSQSARVFRSWVMRSSRSLEEKKAILEKEKRPTILAALAKDPETPVELLLLLHGRMSNRVACSVYHHPDAPAELLVEAALFLEGEGTSERLPGHVEKRILEEGRLHEGIGQGGKGRTAVLLATSAHVTHETRKRMLKILLPALKEEEPHKGQSTYSLYGDARAVREAYHERLSYVYDAVKQLAAENLLTVEDATWLLGEFQQTEPSKSAYYHEDRIRQLQGYLADRGETEFTPGDDAFVQRAGTASGDDLIQVINEVRELGMQDTSGRRELHKLVLTALLENPNLTPEMYIEHVPRLEYYMVRSHAHKRLSRGAEEDIPVLLHYASQGIVTMECVANAVRTNPEIALRVITRAADGAEPSRKSRTRYVGRDVVSHLLKEGLAPKEWLLGLTETDLAKVIELPGADELYARVLLEGLGDDPVRWEVYSETVKHPGTLKERIWAANAL